MIWSMAMYSSEKGRPSTSRRTRAMSSSSSTVFSSDEVMRLASEPAVWLVTSQPARAVYRKLCMVSMPAW